MELQRALITHVLVIDRAGYGWSILWTTDGQTWVNHRRNPINAAERDKALGHLRGNYAPDVTERQVKDFHGRIPPDLVVEGARVI